MHSDTSITIPASPERMAESYSVGENLSNAAPLDSPKEFSATEFRVSNPIEPSSGTSLVNIYSTEANVVEHGSPSHPVPSVPNYSGGLFSDESLSLTMNTELSLPASLRYDLFDTDLGSKFAHSRAQSLPDATSFGFNGFHSLFSTQSDHVTDTERARQQFLSDVSWASGAPRGIAEEGFLESIRGEYGTPSSGSGRTIDSQSLFSSGFGYTDRSSPGSGLVNPGRESVEPGSSSWSPVWGSELGIPQPQLQPQPMQFQQKTWDNSFAYATDIPFSVYDSHPASPPGLSHSEFPNSTIYLDSEDFFSRPDITDLYGIPTEFPRAHTSALGGAREHHRLLFGRDSDYSGESFFGDLSTTDFEPLEEENKE